MILLIIEKSSGYNFYESFFWISIHVRNFFFENLDAVTTLFGNQEVENYERENFRIIRLSFWSQKPILVVRSKIWPIFVVISGHASKSEKMNHRVFISNYLKKLTKLSFKNFLGHSFFKSCYKILGFAKIDLNLKKPFGISATARNFFLPIY